MQITTNNSISTYFSLVSAVNANTEKRTTVSVIRVGSPTPSMESSNESNGEEKTDDENVDDEEKSENSENEEDDNEDGRRKSKVKTKLRKDGIPRIALTVESFYNPDEANKFAEEIMCMYIENICNFIESQLFVICSSQLKPVSRIRVN